MAPWVAYCLGMGVAELRNVFLSGTKRISLFTAAQLLLAATAAEQQQQCVSNEF